jgi:hypothetical protein
VARLADFRHKHGLSAANLAFSSLVVAMSRHFCQRRRCRHNQKPIHIPIRFRGRFFNLTNARKLRKALFTIAEFAPYCA